MPHLARVDAALLYATSPVVDFEAIAQQVNKIMAPSGITLTATETTPGESMTLEARGFGLTFTRFSRKLSQDRLTSALASDYTRLQGWDFTEPVETHTSFIEIIADVDNAHEGGTETLLALAHVAVNNLCIAQPPLAIHWGQCNQLFNPAHFLSMANVIVPLPIFCHPRPFSSGRVSNGVQVVGFRLEGAEHVLGRPLTFREAPAPLPYLLDRAYAFIDHCRESEQIPGSGTSFAANHRELIGVKHTPPSQDHPEGAIELTLRETEGVLQLQPEGTSNPVGMPQAEVTAENLMRNAGPPAVDTKVAPKEVGDAPSGLHSQNGNTTASDPEGLERLLAASADRMERARRHSAARTKNVQLVGFLMGAGLPGLQSAANSPGLQKALPWLNIALIALVHPIIAVLTALLHHFRPLPYYVYYGITALVFLGAVMSGVDPMFGYIDLFSPLMGGSGVMGGMSFPSF